MKTDLICKTTLSIISLSLCLALSAGAAEKAKNKQKSPAAKAPNPTELPALADDQIKKIEEALPTAAKAKPAKARRILVFWRCEGFFHKDGIINGCKALELIGKKTGAFTADISADYQAFEAANLAKYDAVVLNNTTKMALPESGRKALLDFVRSGKGMVGIHAASDNFYDWPEGAQMIGGLFDGHPWTGNGT